jgi:hypothetical protein
VLATAEVKWQVLSAFSTLIDHIANGRVNETMAAFSDDADIAMVGSEAGERATGPEEVRAQFVSIYARPYRVLFDLQPGKVSAHGNVAWLTAEGTYHLSTGDERKPYRVTAVFERRRGKWLWQLFSGAEPPGEAPAA